MRHWQIGRLVEIAAAVALTAAALVFIVARAAASDQAAPEIEVEDAWARPSLGMGATSAAYMTLRNRGSRADALLQAEGEVARAFELHTHMRDGDIVRMRRVEDGIELPPGATVELAPGGYHVMLIGLTRTLEDGDGFPLTLRFRSGAAVTVDVDVRAGVPADRRPHGPAGHHGH